jgi:quercetin dioxygenase-like cupin family protein
MDFTFPVGSDSSPGHYHALHAETYFLISGRMEWIVEGEKQILESGDLVYVPPNAYHSARTLGDEPARTIFIFDPGGFEHDVYARNALTEGQKNDPAFMAEFFRSIDYHFDPARAHDHDAP